MMVRLHIAVVNGNSLEGGQLGLQLRLLGRQGVARLGRRLQRRLQSGQMGHL